MSCTRTWYGPKKALGAEPTLHMETTPHMEMGHMYLKQSQALQLLQQVIQTLKALKGTIGKHQGRGGARLNHPLTALYSKLYVHMFDCWSY